MTDVPPSATSVSTSVSTSVASPPQRRWAALWETHLLPKGIPILLGLVLGTLLAFFIVSEEWHLVFGLVLLVPAVILFNTYPFAGLMIWLLLMPFLQTTPTETYRYVYWIVHRALPPLALIVAALANLFQVPKKRQPVRLGRAEWAMIFYLGLVVLNIFWFHAGSTAYLYLFYDRVFVPFCLYLFVRVVAPREAELKRLMPIAFVIVMVQCVVGVLSWFAPRVLPTDWLTLQGARTTGTLAYPHAYTTTLVVFSFLLFQDAMNRKPGVVRSAFLFAFGFSAVCIFISFSRGSWLGGAAAAMGLLMMYPKTTVRTAVVVLILMTLLGSGVLSQQMAYARERMNSEDTAKDRLVIWDAGLQMIKAKPLFGWGYGDYAEYAGQFQRRVANYMAAYSHASHNSYIAMAAETGVPAFLLFMFPVLWWLMLSLKVWPRMPKEGLRSRLLVGILWMVILDHIIVSFFSDMRHSTYGMGMWWIALGLIASTVETYRNGTE